MIEVRGGVLFDIDGTLLAGAVFHLSHLGATLSRHVGREVRIRIEGERPMLDDTEISGWVDAQLVRAVLRAGSPDGAAEPEVARVMAAYERDYAQVAPPPSMRVIDGVAASLERLRVAGIPIGLVTGNASFVARSKLAALGLDGYFRFDRDLGFGDWRVDRSEVAAAAVAALAAEVGDVESIVYAGDTPRDMEAARAAGVRAIGVLSGAGDAARLLGAGAEAVIPSVADLYPAGYPTVRRP